MKLSSIASSTKILLFASVALAPHYVDSLRATHSKPSFEDAIIDSTEKHYGRFLNDGVCLCDDEKEITTIRMISPGEPGNYILSDRFRNRAEAYFNKTGIKVEVITVGSLETVFREMLADAGKAVYDGYVFQPSIIAEMTELGGLADLTDFVAANQDVAWTDMLVFERETQAVYDNKVRSLPCDGDVHNMYYRKDLFDKYNLDPPRTWDEFTERAEFFHGKEVDNGYGNGTVTLSGSCIERASQCDLSYTMFLSLHAATVQSQGTSQGLLFDSKTFSPNLGEALAESLRHAENHAKYGSQNELDDGPCSYPNLKKFFEGTCAMTYYWGDAYARHLYEGSVFNLDGKIGSALTPGVTKVLDPEGSGKLVQCTEKICPHGVTYPDIGRVNYAPFAAAGGWAAAVAGGLSKERQQAMAGFIGFVCGKDESLVDVITDARAGFATGADPFRTSHFEVENHGSPAMLLGSRLEPSRACKYSLALRSISIFNRANRSSFWEGSSS